MKVKILRNKRKPWTAKIEKEVCSLLNSRKIEIVKKGAEITICIGGDGTIFHFNHINKLEGPIAGIGSETSHICQLRENNWKKKLVRMVKRKKSESRIMLLTKIGKKTYSAINDVVLHTVDYRVITTTVKLDKTKKSFEGDGIIIATPTGSTAYAYSAGGLVIDEGVEAIDVVPICPYKRRVPPEIVHENTKIKIHADRISDLVIDGIFIKKLKPNETVKIQKGKKIEFLV